MKQLFFAVCLVPLLAGCPEETKPNETTADAAHPSAVPVASQAIVPSSTATVAATPDASTPVEDAGKAGDAGKDAGKPAPKK